MTLRLVNIENNLIPNGNPTYVSDNDVARLMHYVHCVFRVIEYTHRDAHRYRDYQNWSSLNEAEQCFVLILAMAFHIDQLDGKVLFHSEELCRGMINKFYALNKVCNQLLVKQSIVVAGRTCRVKQIMTYTKSFRKNNFIEPVKRLSERFKQQQVQKPSPQNTWSFTSRIHHNKYQDKKSFVSYFINLIEKRSTWVICDILVPFAIITALKKCFQ